MKTKSRKGFTLVELLAVVLIILVLVLIAVPNYQRSILKSRASEVHNLLAMVRTRQAVKFARDKQFAATFEDPVLKKIAMGPNDREINQGAIKRVNTDYELELRSGTDDQNNPVNCVIGRYKPGGENGETKFTFGIAYTKNGLACEDGNINWSICKSFGSAIIEGSLDEICRGVAPGQTGCGDIHCNECQYLDPNTCTCVDNTYIMTLVGNNDNYEFDATNPPFCKSCKYSCEEGSENSARKNEDTSSHTISLVPSLTDIEFDCLDPEGALGAEPIDCAEYDTDDNQTCLKRIYKCHSAHYMTWNCGQCKWQCVPPANVNEDEICNGDQIWNSSACMCTCKPGTRCICHETQYFHDGDCRCFAPEAMLVDRDNKGCMCKERKGGEYPNYGEDLGDRVLNTDKTHCQCTSDRHAVYFGTVVDKNGSLVDPSPNNTHVIPISYSDALEHIAKNEYWEAACCRPNDFRSSLPYFEYPTCCPHVTYRKDGIDNDYHVDFNGKEGVTACCPNDKPVYNSSKEDKPVTDNNSQYLNRAAGTFPGQICHKCEYWYQAYDSNEAGCYDCPGKTWTTWSDSESASVCSCPTGTEGGVSISHGIAIDDCKCSKHNTHWETAVNYPADPSTITNRSAWHSINGACQCDSNYVDTYYGLELSDATQTSGSTVDVDSGFCCPSDLEATVYGGITSSDKACCPADKKYFHNTDFAHRSCAKCQNQTDTFVDGQCQPCPAGMEPVFDVDLGYALCKCPTGTHYKTGASYTQAAAIASNVSMDSICECDLPNAVWQFPQGVSNANFVTAVANGTTSSLSGWSNTNGYCVCDTGFKFADHGSVGETTITSSGYCCPTTEGSQLGHWWQSTNPTQNFCCTTGVPFNQEPGYGECCAAPAQAAYFSLDQLATAGLTKPERITGEPEASVAIIGGCARCTNPAADGENNCQNCPSPRVPVWNNNPHDGYSECKCPLGSIEYSAEESQSFWDKFLNLVSLGHYHSYTQDDLIKNGCKCKDDNAVWTSDGNGNYICKCPTGFVQDQLTGSCCPQEQKYYYEGACHPCPQETPHYYIAPGDTEYGCYACAPDRPYSYNGVCCPNPVDTNITGNAYYHDSLGRCTVCSQPNQIYNAENGCVSVPSSINCEWEYAEGVPNCSCGENAGSYNPATQQCECENNNYAETQCACNKCASLVNNSNTHNWILGWQTLGSQTSCNCGNYRIFNDGCCTDSSINCCPCAQGRTDTALGDETLLNQNNHCCPNKDLAPNNINACCGQGIYFNSKDGNCCTSDRPYYYYEDAINFGCSVCQDPMNTYYDASTQSCKACAAPKVLSEWNNTYKAYTKCACPAGTGSVGAGAWLPPDGSEVCRCPFKNTSWDPQDGVCKCDGNFGTIYNTENMMIESCCPLDRYHDNQCCPLNTKWDSVLGKCVKCSQPASQVIATDDGQCQYCSDITEVNTDSWSDDRYAYTKCKCPYGMVLTSTNGRHGDIVTYVSIKEKDKSGSGISNSSCACPLQGQHYVDSNFVQTTYGKGQCRSCPAGSSWEQVKGTNTYACLCNNGFEMGKVNGVDQCICKGNKHAFFIGNSEISATLQSCSAGSDGCVCAACPSNTHWCDNGAACKCDYRHKDEGGNWHGIHVYTTDEEGNIIQNNGVNAVFQTSQGGYFSNVVKYKSATIGYCNFSCKALNAPILLSTETNVYGCATCPANTHGHDNGHDTCSSLWEANPYDLCGF